jgi:hypothetical protein
MTPSGRTAPIVVRDGRQEWVKHPVGPGLIKLTGGVTPRDRNASQPHRVLQRLSAWHCCTARTATIGSPRSPRSRNI